MYLRGVATGLLGSVAPPLSGLCQNPDMESDGQWRDEQQGLTSSEESLRALRAERRVRAERVEMRWCSCSPRRRSRRALLR